MDKIAFALALSIILLLGPNSDALEKLAIQGVEGSDWGQLQVVHAPEQPKFILLMLLDTPELLDSTAADKNLLQFAKANHAALACGHVSRPRDARTPGEDFFQASIRSIGKSISNHFGHKPPIYCAAHGGYGKVVAESFRNFAAWIAIGSGIEVGERFAPSSPGLFLSTSSAVDQLSLASFKTARKNGGNVTWLRLNVAKTPAAKGENPPDLNAAVIQYVSSLLPKNRRSLYADILTKEEISSSRSIRGAETQAYLPSPEFADFWTKHHNPTLVVEDRPLIYEREERTGVESQPTLTLMLRLPIGTQRMSETKGVLALVTFSNDLDKLRRRLNTPGDFLIKYAEDHRLALLTWDSATLWATGQSYFDLDRDTAKAFDQRFDNIATAWDRGVRNLEREHGFAAKDMLFYGVSRGAHWGHRLALRQSDRFLAVHFHVANSYDQPTIEAGRCLWLLTTGERDIGYYSTQKFFEECRKLNYPMIIKAGVNLGHSETPDTRKLGLLFFDYALAQKALRDGFVSKAASENRSASAEELFPWLDSFLNPPFVGDFVNHEVYPSSKAALVPESQRVPIPSKELATLWSQIRP